VNGARHLSFALLRPFSACIVHETIAFWERYLLGNDASIASDDACVVRGK
jgi:hypothetical protein